MDINVNLKEKIDEFPDELRDIALLLLKEIDRGKKSKRQMEDMIMDEIRELLYEEEI